MNNTMLLNTLTTLQSVYESVLQGLYKDLDSTLYNIERQENKLRDIRVRILQEGDNESMIMWGDMTDEERGAILLAQHRGTPIKMRTGANLDAIITTTQITPKDHYYYWVAGL